MHRYAALFDVPVVEAFEWINGYVNHTERMFPEQFKALLIEENDAMRFKSIAGYITNQIEGAADTKIRADLAVKQLMDKQAA